jgi:hypothetical protein
MPSFWPWWDGNDQLELLYLILNLMTIMVLCLCTMVFVSYFVRWGSAYEPTTSPIRQNQ